jgi:hypothetical protein
MRELPQWALELLATPPMDLAGEIFSEPDSEQAEALFFRFRLLSAYVKVQHANPDSIQDPLLRVMVRLSDEAAYSMNLDSGKWIAFFSVLRDNTPDHFANWFNQHRSDFWLDSSIDMIVPWVYEDANGNVVERSPGMNAAMQDVIAALAEAEKSPPGTKSSAKQGGCYIATAVYGSYDDPPVLALRRYRDERLARSVLGRGFIQFYYAVSPALSKHFRAGTIPNRIGKRALDALVRKLES